MSRGFSAFLRSSGGKAAGILFTLAAVVAAALVVKSAVSSDMPPSMLSSVYIDSENGKTFEHVNKEGDVFPLLSPYSGKQTGYRAEACYWTASGGTKTDPTWVLLNEAVGKPGPTFCPDCGRLVVGHNPPPRPGLKPPPTKEEYAARHGGASPTAAAAPTVRDEAR